MERAAITYRAQETNKRKVVDPLAEGPREPDLHRLRIRPFRIRELHRLLFMIDYRRIVGICYCCSVLILSVGTALAQDSALVSVGSNEALGVKTAIVNSLANYFDGIGLQYESSDYYVRPNPENNENPIYILTTDYKGQYPFFDFKFNQVDGNGKNIGLIKEVAYDGKYYQVLSEDGRLDLFKVGSYFNDSSLCSIGSRNPSFFAPFWFINPEVIRNPYHIDQIWDLKQLIRTNPSFADMVVLGNVNVHGINCVEITVKIGITYRNKELKTWPSFPNDVAVSAYLDRAAGYYPIKWQMISKERGVLIDYQIERLGSFKNDLGMNFYYPAKSVMTDWGSLLPKNVTKPYVWRDEIKSASVISGKAEASDYTIDPGLANLIIDNDKHIQIPVPQ
jgi:hypothetical protein